MEDAEGRRQRSSVGELPPGIVRTTGGKRGGFIVRGGQRQTANRRVVVESPARLVTSALPMFSVR